MTVEIKVLLLILSVIVFVWLVFKTEGRIFGIIVDVIADVFEDMDFDD